MTTASPTKLRNGSWGARVPGTVRQGQTITIRTRAGKQWAAEVSRVLWTGADRSGQTVSLCATRSLDRPRGTWGGRAWDAEYCGGICPVGGFRCSPRNGPCHDCE